MVDIGVEDDIPPPSCPNAIPKHNPGLFSYKWGFKKVDSIQPIFYYYNKEVIFNRALTA